jgi:two-component system, cell cycle response regulator DivK
MDSPLILIVEDNTDAREIFSTYLRHSGFSVAEASDGVDVLRLTKELRPAVVLMDLSMPQVDGWTALRQLKADEQTAGVPVVALTAHSMEGDEQKTIEAGFISYLSKPLDPKKMVSEVRRILAD